MTKNIENSRDIGPIIRFIYQISKVLRNLADTHTSVISWVRILIKQSELDEKFILIMDQIITMIVQAAGKSSQQILNVSEEFLSKKAHQAIQDFYSLYFNPSDTIEASKAQMNKDVDDLFDQAQDAVGSGIDVSSTL